MLLDYLCPFVFRLDLILPAISQPILQRLQRVRCALRALMMPISLSILLPFHLGRVIEIHGDIFVSNAHVTKTVNLKDASVLLIIKLKLNTINVSVTTHN